MFTYNVCTATDRSIFDKAVKKLEAIEGFERNEKSLEDVDGSLIAVFNYMNSKVLLKNDEAIGAIYIESERDIENLIFD